MQQLTASRQRISACSLDMKTIEASTNSRVAGSDIALVDQKPFGLPLPCHSFHNFTQVSKQTQQRQSGNG